MSLLTLLRPRVAEPIPEEPVPTGGGSREEHPDPLWIREDDEAAILLYLMLWGAHASPS